MKVLILGGTGVISRAIVQLLLKEKFEVVLFNRGNKPSLFGSDVEHISGDRLDRTAFRNRLRKERYDAVIDMICFNSEDARSTLQTFRENTGHIVICSSIAAYKRPYRTVPTVEGAELLWDNPEFPYAYNKAEVERLVSRVLKKENLPVTLIRPSLTYGEGASNIGVLRQNYGIVRRIRKGKPLVMFGDGSTPWSWTFAPDLAKVFVGVLGNEKTFGQAYHATSDQRCIWEDLYLEFGKLVGKAPEIVHIPSELLYMAAPGLCNHLHFEKTYSGLFDNTKIRQAVPGFTTDISLKDGLQSIFAWWEREAPEIDPEKDELEDRLVNIYNHWADQMKNLYTR